MEVNEVPTKTVGAKNLELGQNSENCNEKRQSLYSSPDIWPAESTRAGNIAVPSIHTVYEK
jgi:hypothetical protein